MTRRPVILAAVRNPNGAVRRSLRGWRAAWEVALEDGRIGEQRLQGLIREAGIATPVFVYEESQLLADAACARSAIRAERTDLLFAIKSFSVEPALRVLAAHLDGFSVSSLFEARLARRVLGRRGQIHFTSPGLRADEIDELCELCSVISFNSFSQWQRFRNVVRGRVGCALRINPGLSFVDDERYDPCRRHSRLGEPIARVADALRQTPELLTGIDGVLVHNNCESVDLGQLLQTVQRVDLELAPLLQRLDWVNLGGGYLFYEAADRGPLRRAIDLLMHRCRGRIVFEPGAAIAKRAGTLVASVDDVLDRDGVDVAVLDCSVNHMPEAFEYQFAPAVSGTTDDGAHAYQLSGCTCLAGDLFGIHRFTRSLQVGSLVSFPDCGAYTLVKAHFFNGVNLPSICSLGTGNALQLRARSSFAGFLEHCGATKDAG